MTTTHDNSTFHKMAFTLLAIGAFCLGLSATAGATPYRDAPNHKAGKSHKQGKAFRGKTHKQKRWNNQGRMKKIMRKFNELDRNDDGRIGPRELRAAPKRLRKRLRAANTNGDRFITRTEVRRAFNKRGKRDGKKFGHGHDNGKGHGDWKRNGKGGKRGHDTWKRNGKRGKRGHDTWKRNGKRGDGAVIRDHRSGKVTKLIPSYRMERVSSRRGTAIR